MESPLFSAIDKLYKDCGGNAGDSFVKTLLFLPVTLPNQVKTGYTAFNTLCLIVISFTFRVSIAT